MDCEIVGFHMAFCISLLWVNPLLYFLVSLLNSLTYSRLLLYFQIRIIYLIPSINVPPKSPFLVSLLLLLLHVKDKQ